MTPGLRPAVVQRRLVEMRQLLEFLRQRRGVPGEALAEDLTERLAVERALAALVDLATAVNGHVLTATGATPPADYYTSFVQAADVGLLDDDLARRLAPSAGLRNRIVHEYEDIDLQIVAGAIDDAVDGFDDYVQAVARWLRDR